MSNPAPEDLNLTVDLARWEWLRSHLDRGGVLLVSPHLELIEAGFCIATDDVAAVSDWIARGDLSKPSAGQVFDWDAVPETLFRMIIISPYVLVQLCELEST